MAFSVGESVEICSKEEGFAGSFYGARVIGRLGKDLYKVEHTNILNDDKSGPLVEIVSADELRPAPRRRLPTDFGLLQEVDVSDNGGWWVGQVTAKIAGSKYIVYVDRSGEHMVCPLYRLRIHEDWINGQWVSSKKFEIDLK